jgi:hypothetical protein
MPAGLNSDSSQALRSLDNLAGITADALLAGRGEPWTGGLSEAISRAKAAGTSQRWLRGAIWHEAKSPPAGNPPQVMPVIANSSAPCSGYTE